MKDAKEKQEKGKEWKKCRNKEGRNREKNVGGTGGKGRGLLTPDELDGSGAARVWR